METVENRCLRAERNRLGGAAGTPGAGWGSCEYQGDLSVVWGLSPPLRTSHPHLSQQQKLHPRPSSPVAGEIRMQGGRPWSGPGVSDGLWSRVIHQTGLCSLRQGRLHRDTLGASAGGRGGGGGAGWGRGGGEGAPPPEVPRLGMELDSTAL